MIIPAKPTQQQWLAASPEVSAWVSANAGSGKTKVLTDRVLRLLLEGVQPHRILCLTYTKAAAAEMSVRIQDSLRKWVTLSDEELQQHLTALLDTMPDARKLRRARQLFAVVVDNPDGIHIQTIHSLCQSLLRKFSLEAGVSPHFRLMSDHESFIVMEDAKAKFLTAQINDRDGKAMREALMLIASHVSETTFHKLLDEAVARRQELTAILAVPPELHMENLRKALGIMAEELSCTPQERVNTWFRYTDAEVAALRKLAEIASTGSERDDRPIANGITAWLDSARGETDALTWVQCFFTKAGEPRKKFFTKAIRERVEDMYLLFEREWSQALQYRELHNRLLSLRMSDAAFHVIAGMQAAYAALKQQRGVLDYEDLISRTSALIRNPRIAPWVLYKLDGGLDHILVDEAQDTSQIQWQLVETLANEFFSGEAAAKYERTLFVVGDEKQSIYSFQGAAPEAFNRMKHHFAQQVRGVEKRFEAVNLLLSYRSTSPILTLVDEVFASPSMQEGVVEEGNVVRHVATRDKGGRVELWPLMESEEEEDRESFSVSDEHLYAPRAEKLLAEHLALTIAGWLKERRWLEGRGRPIRAGDIMILVRNRSGIFYQLLTALKRHQLPLAGADRLKLSEQLAVQDMLALADFLLLPEDDLSLAGILKSPLFNFSEEDIYTLCQPRTGSVWEELKNQTAPYFIAAREMLESWLALVDYLPPFEFFSRILEASGGRQKFVARMGDEVQDPLSELLALTLEYEQLHQPSMQGFVQWFRQIPVEVKRDLDQSRDAVRILTIHGSKGLEAPVVILPDMTAASKDDTQIFLQDSPAPALLWAFNAEIQPPVVKELRENGRRETQKEERRLLYVALTRAADELIIAGYKGKRTLAENCWYRSVAEAMQRCAVEEVIPWQEGEASRWLLDTTSADRIDKIDVRDAEQIKPAVLPDWLGRIPPEEAFPPRPLVPSRTEEMTVAEKENTLPDAAALQRGKAIHMLLEVLPELDVKLRHDAGLLLLNKYWLEGSSEHQQNIQQIEAIMAHPEFSEVFAGGSQAEVPITAVIEDAGLPRILTGQIDRLLITGDKILLVDYKTSQRIPANTAAIPKGYIRQLQGYRQALNAIYPDKKVEAAILWTQGPVLMPVVLV